MAFGGGLSGAYLSPNTDLSYSALVAEAPHLGVQSASPLPFWEHYGVIDEPEGARLKICGNYTEG